MAQIHFQKDSDDWKEWYDTRPPIIKDLIDKYPPWILYQFEYNRVFVCGWNEEGTVHLAVTGQFNRITHERQVFDADPTDLIECDLPDKGELVGFALSHDEVMECCDAGSSADDRIERTIEKAIAKGREWLKPFFKK